MFLIWDYFAEMVCTHHPIIVFNRTEHSIKIWVWLKSVYENMTTKQSLGNVTKFHRSFFLFGIDWIVAPWRMWGYSYYLFVMSENIPCLQSNLRIWKSYPTPPHSISWLVLWMSFFIGCSGSSSFIITVEETVDGLCYSKFQAWPNENAD